jgi:SWI/SNF-related matrix-associated actin-dependent regulator of chromatin subfamily A member 5
MSSLADLSSPAEEGVIDADEEEAVKETPREELLSLSTALSVSSSGGVGTNDVVGSSSSNSNDRVSDDSSSSDFELTSDDEDEDGDRDDEKDENDKRRSGSISGSYSDPDSDSDFEQGSNPRDSRRKSNASIAESTKSSQLLTKLNQEMSEEIGMAITKSYFNLAPYKETLRPFVPDSVDRKLAGLSEMDQQNAVVVDKSIKQPSNMASTCSMRWYQVEGLQWLNFNYNRGVNCILADEMGLGKTIQVISFICRLIFELQEPGRHLIVVPLSVLFNWVNEFKKFCPAVAPLRLHSNDKAEQRRLLHILGSPDLCPPVVLVTYESLKGKMRAGISKIVWRSIILDEGHRIKRTETQIAQVAKTMRARFKLILTGTPVQNNLVETYGLLNFLMPHIFSSPEPFDSAFILGGGSNSASASSSSVSGSKRKLTEDANDDDSSLEIGVYIIFTVNNSSSAVSIDRNRLDEMHYVMRLFVLRRLKIEVEQSLPMKLETLVYCPMTDLQRKCFQQLFAQDSAAILKMQSSHDENDSASTDDQVVIKSAGRLQGLLAQLRKASNHPFLFEGVEKVSATGEPTDEIIYASGKMVMLEKLLTQLKAKGHRVALFSQFTRTLDIICDFLDYRRFRFCRLDGSTNRIMREVHINMFNKPNSDLFVFCLSTRAGGEGINLTTADTVILFDSDWNPQVDIQAMARVHRIGQTKTVHVYRLVTKGSVEERIIQRAQKKLFLDGMVNRDKTKQANESIEEQQDSIENVDHNFLMSMIRFGWNSVFSADEETNLAESELTDGDIALLIDRNRGTKSTSAPESLSAAFASLEEKAPSVQKLAENQEQTLLAFDENAPLVPIRNKTLSSSPSQSPRIARICGLEVDTAVDHANMGRSKRQRKSRLTEVLDDSDGESYPVLLANNYSLDEGEPSIFATETSKKKVDLYTFQRRESRQIAGRDYSNEDICQVCGDGGDLVLCDFCPVACHLQCVGLDEAPANWYSCPHHTCCECKRAAGSGEVLFRCEICEAAYCEDCMPSQADVIGNCKRFEDLGFSLPSSAVYIHCSAKCARKASNREKKEQVGVDMEVEADIIVDVQVQRLSETSEKFNNLTRRSVDAILSCGLQDILNRLKVNSSPSAAACKFLSLADIPNFKARWNTCSSSVKGLLLACIHAYMDWKDSQATGPSDGSSLPRRDNSFEAVHNRVLTYGGVDESLPLDNIIEVFTSMTRVLTQVKKNYLFDLCYVLGICEFIPRHESLDHAVVNSVAVHEPLFRYVQRSCGKLHVI